jgi:Family of unknown function (DUF5682)
VLLHDAALLELLDGWVATMPADAFDDIVPLLRRAVGSFAPAERRQLGQLVSGRGDGRAPAAYGWDLDENRAGRALLTVAELLGVSR